MFQEDYVATLKQELDGIYKRAITYLENNKVLLPFQESWNKPDNFNIDEWYSKTVTEPEQREAEILTQNISRVVKSLASSAKSSPLINEADIRDMSFCLKKSGPHYSSDNTGTGILTLFMMREQF